jgi:uncharacterized membrane protein
MFLRLGRAWERIQGSLWFVPSVLVLLSVGLALLMIWLDRHISYQHVASLPVVLEAGPEGARDMLSTIAGSVLAVAGVAFSFTIVVFSFASSQYASRVLHNFMDDNTNQVVLGVLLGSFVYCLLVLRTVRLEDTSFVPVLSVSMALLLALADLGLFILFIHHIAESIQAYHIIQRVGAATNHAVEMLFPPRPKPERPSYEAGASATPGSSSPDRQPPSVRPPAGIAPHVYDNMLAVDPATMREVHAVATGYIQMVDYDLLMKVASKHDLLVVLTKSPGNFAIKGETIAAVSPMQRATDEVCEQIRYSFVLGPHRTLFQDPQYGVLLLSDIAIKALSPAINDPNTAIMSLNQVGGVLRQVVQRQSPTQLHCDATGKVRIVAEVPSFESMMSQAFDQVRRYGSGDASVVLKLLDVLAEIAEDATDRSQIHILREHMHAIVEDCDRRIATRRDRIMINNKLLTMLDALQLTREEVTLLRIHPDGAEAP